MKPLMKLILFLWIFCQFCAARVPDSANQAVPATVYFFRLPNFVGSAAKMTIFSNNQPIVRLQNAAYFKYEAQPGDYTFSLTSGSSSKVRLSVESGKEYYVKCYYNMGFWSSIGILELVDTVSGKAIIDGNELLLQPVEPVSLKARKSRAGLLLSAGFGFETFPWFIDEAGDEVTLSTGGGFGIGGEYGHQLGRNFDLSFNCFFQSSGLSERLKNADGSFYRMGLTVTPAIVIPIKGGDILRFRIGAGPGFYTLGTMKIDGSKIDGTRYTFKYKSAFGIHALILFESNFMERGAMNLGIRYSNIQYQFTSNGSSNDVTDPKLLKPDGSGIDFILGYSFLF